MGIWHWIGSIASAIGAGMVAFQYYEALAYVVMTLGALLVLGLSLKDRHYPNAFLFAVFVFLNINGYLLRM